MAIKRAIKAGNKSIISFKKAIKVGDITQWFDKDKFSPSQTDRTLTFTNNGDGSVTVSGVVVNTARVIYGIPNLKELVKGHKYLLSGCPKSTDDHFLSLNVYNNDSKLLEMYIDSGLGLIFTFDQEYYSRYIGGAYIYERQVGAEVNRTYIPQLFDLTEMFGAGHEPATVAEFKAKFPEAYYPYQRAVLTVYNKVVRPCARKGEVVQLVDPTIFNKTQEVEGITYTGNNGVVSASGTATVLSLFDLKTKFSDIFSDHIYLITGCPENGSLQTYNLRYSTYGFGDIGNGAITSGENINNFRIVITRGTTVENLIFTPQLFDLTAMYGAGNEPKTLADFRKDFPESYYPYSPIQTKNLLKLKLDTVQHNVVPKIVRDTLDINVNDRGGYAQLDAYLPAGTYTLSAMINNNNDYAEKNNYTILSKEKNAGGIIRTGYLQNTLTFTLDKDRSFYILIYPAYGVYSGVYRTAQYKLQIEKGSVATDYVPHDYI